MLRKRLALGSRLNVNIGRATASTSRPSSTRRKARIAGSSALLLVGAISLQLLVSTTPAVGTTRRSPPSGKQLAELRGSDTVAGDGFGYSVAISGTLAVVGAPWHASDHAIYVGRAYVFTKAANGWKQVAELAPPDTDSPRFGYSVAISGATIVVGAPDAGAAGEVCVFTRTGAAWKLVTTLTGSDIVPDAAFGSTVGVSGTTAIVGDYDRAYVFTKTGTAWKQSAVLKGPNTVGGLYLWYSVAISGATAVVGAGDQTGRAYVFTKTGAAWKRAAVLKGSDTVANDDFASVVAISGATILVGAPSAKDVGRAYVFMKKGNAWKQAAELKGAVTAYDFGSSVAISGTTALVGPAADVFSKKGAAWRRAAQLKGTVAGDGFGESVAISGTTAVVGAWQQANGAGRAYVFED